MSSQREKNNKVIAAATTIGMYAILFLVFFFAVAWRAPYPPLPGGGGIELNFGLDDVGFGDVQPDIPVGTEQPQPKQEEAPQQEQPQVEEKQPEKTEEADVVSTDEESPVTVKKKEDEPKKKEVKPEPVKPVENPVKEKETPKKEETPKTVYNPNSNTTTGKDGGKEGKPGNHGDNPGTTGDKGSPQGSLDAKALYGKPGSGGDGSGSGRGPGLDLAGWTWDNVPDPVIPATETGGRLVFEIKVDADGEIISIKTLERSVSLETEKACRKEVERLTFSKTGANVPTISTGKITFVVRSN